MQPMVPSVVTHRQATRNGIAGTHPDEAISLTREPAGMTSADFGLAGFDDGFCVMA